MDRLERAASCRIREVIWGQLQALASLDGERALRLLTPARRAGSGATFLRTIAQTFPALTRARNAEFGPLGTRDGRYVQPVRVTTWDRRTVDATYVVEQRPDGSYLIEGCVCSDGPGRALPN